MEILKEAKKEELPVAFITSFVSDGWEKVGILKEEIEAIKKEFSNTKKAEELIQALIDAYLVCIGQMEQYLADSKNIEVPAEEIKESLTEDVNINIENVTITEPEIEVEKPVEDVIPAAEIPAEEIAIPEPTEKPEEVIEAEKTLADKVGEIEAACKDGECEEKPAEDEKFEYFVDEFPEPVKEINPDDED